MVRVRGMNVPPELAKDVGKLIERRVGDTSGVVARRRSTGGISRGGREAVNAAFLESVACWHMQTLPQKQDWYRKAQMTGMRYYNFFMGETIGEFYRGRVPVWCFPLQDGLLQVTNFHYDGDNIINPGVFSSGQRLYLEITAAWANFTDWDSIQFSLLLQTLDDRFLQLGITIQGGSSCVDLTEDVYSDPGRGDFYKYGYVTGPSSYPSTFSIRTDLPSFFDVNNISDARVILSADVFGYGLPIEETPVAWIYHTYARAGTEVIYENNYEGEDLQPLEVEMNVNRVYAAMPDPWNVWGFGDPVCTYGEVE